MRTMQKHTITLNTGDPEITFCGERIAEFAHEGHHLELFKTEDDKYICHIVKNHEFHKQNDWGIIAGNLDEVFEFFPDNYEGRELFRRAGLKKEQKTMQKHTTQRGAIELAVLIPIILIGYGVTKIVDMTANKATGNDIVQLGCGQQVYFLPENQVETISAYLAKNGVTCEVLK